LAPGHTARITVGDGQRIVAGVDGAEILVWEMHASFG
jgi:quercetin 2,3-dioxygenase